MERVRRITFDEIEKERKDQRELARNLHRSYAKPPVLSMCENDFFQEHDDDNDSGNSSFTSRRTSISTIYKDNCTVAANIRRQPWQQMVLPDTPFRAKLLGVNEFGYFIIQRQDEELHGIYYEFHNHLDKFYSDQNTCAKFQLELEEITNGLRVVAFVNEKFIRAVVLNINTHQILCEDIDTRNSHFVLIDKKDIPIYRITETFAKLVPMAVMCSLELLGPFMMTSEIANAYSAIPHQFKNQDVMVTVSSKKCVCFKVPAVSMTTVTDKVDIFQHFLKFGRKSLAEFHSDLDVNNRKAFQQEKIKYLHDKNYFPS